MDWAENAALLGQFRRAWDHVVQFGTVSAAQVDLGRVHAFGVVKWAALAAPVTLLVVVYAIRAAQRLITLRTVIRKQLPLLVVATVFGVILLVPPQGLDAVRGLSIARLFGTLAVVLVLGQVLTLAGATALRKQNLEGQDAPVRSTAESRRRRLAPSAALMAVAVALAVVGSLLGWKGLLVPAVLLGALALVSAFIDFREPSGATPPERRFGDATIADFDRRVSLSSVAGALVVVGFGAALVETAALDFAYFSSADGVAARMGIGLAILGVAPFVRGWFRRVGCWVEARSDARKTLVAVLLTLLVVPGLIFHDPDLNLRFAPQFGAVVVLAMFLGGMALLLVWADRLAFYLARNEQRRMVFLPTILREFGVSRPPVVSFVVVWAVVAGIGFRGTGHEVRVVTGSSVAEQSLDSIVGAWIERHPSLAAANMPNAAVPALLVSSSGGGIRAAYWTAAVLDCVTEGRTVGSNPCARETDPAAVARRRSALLAMSGVSGGSVGIAEYVSETVPVGPGERRPVAPVHWYDEKLGVDFLSSTLAALLFNDGLNSLIRPDHPVDRAAITERSWEKPWSDGRLGRHYLADQATQTQPLLLLSGYSVEDGCRFSASILAVNAGRTAQQCAKAATGRDGELLASTDLPDVLCAGTDVRWSTAALLSARFPWISPTGSIGRGACGDPAAHTQVGDGGYHEASAASAVNELMPRVHEIIDEQQQGCVVPLFLQIDNGYSGPSSTADSAVGQITAPITGILKSTAGWEAAARADSRRIFGGAFGKHPQATVSGTPVARWFHIETRAHPGAKAPLGWVLSKTATDDLKDQLKGNRAEIERLRKVLDAGTNLECAASLVDGSNPG